MDVFTRSIAGFGVERASIDGVSACRMVNHAVAGRPLPKHLSTDHDPLFRFHRWLANLRVLEIEEIKSGPYAPVSHPFIERLIGAVRGEYPDHVFFWNSIASNPKVRTIRGLLQRAACTAPWTAPAGTPRLRTIPLLLHLITALGGSTAAVCSRRPSRRSYQSPPTGYGWPKTIQDGCFFFGVCALALVPTKSLSVDLVAYRVPPYFWSVTAIFVSAGAAVEVVPTVAQPPTITATMVIKSARMISHR